MPRATGKEHLDRFLRALKEIPQVRVIIFVDTASNNVPDQILLGRVYIPRRKNVLV